MRWRPAALILVAIVVVASCSGDDGTAATTLPRTTTRAPATTAPPSTLAAGDSTAAPTAPTTVPPTAPGTTATTTEPTTAPAPPTTTEFDDPRFAVIEAVEAGMLAVIDAVRDPRNDDRLAALDQFFTGTLLDGWRNVVSEYRQNNYQEIENPEQPDAFIIDLASVVVDEEGTVAAIQGCEITSGVVVEVGGNPDGTDRVIEDGISRVVIELKVVNVDGDWKISEVVEPDESDRIASCD